jgi:hypothetical protein
MPASRTADRLTFAFKPIKMLLWMALFVALALGFLWMAYASLAPNFYDSTSSGRHAWVGDLLGSLPVWGRVGIWALLAALCAFGGFFYLRRWLSGLPPLAASPEGVTGFTKGFGLKQITIPWSEVTKVQEVQSNLFVYGSAVDTGGVRQPKPPVISAHLGMMGERFETVVRELETYRASLASAG